MKHIVYICMVMALMSCTDNSSLQAMLDAAGDNRKELEKVLQHYEKDKQKYDAACFLISNMGGKCTSVGKGVDEFHTFIDSVYQIRQQEYDIPAIYEAYKKKAVYYGRPPERLWDLRYITADYLIKSIDEAFEVWPKPWNKHLSFDEFCEWILPYRFYDERLEDWRTLYKKEFEGLLSDSIQTAKDACTVINNKLISLPIHIALSSVRPSSIRPSSLLHMKFGLCEDYATMAVYAMRSLGIPVGIEVIPHWGNNNNSHTFNVVYDNDGSFYDFSGGEQNPGEHLKRFVKRIPKVYRKMCGKNPESLAALCGNEALPLFFRNPFMVDVTGNYDFIGAKNISLPCEQGRKKEFAYLCVFDPKGWAPVAWGRVEKDSIYFRNVGPNIVYHLAYYEDGSLVMSGHPFLLDSLGHINKFIPSESLQKMVLTRKNPEAENLLSIPARVVGGKFQAANARDFHDAEDLYVIADTVPFKYVTIPVHSSHAYKFVRYLSSNQCRGNMAEVEFYAIGKDKPLCGKVIGRYTPSIYYPSNGAEKLFDKDALTFFHTADTLSWGGLELPTSEHIGKIRFIIRNDDNGIRMNNLYELFYMRDGVWVSAGRKQADEDDYMVFENVPGNALYWLRNLTRGKEERIFTYKEGSQVWY